MLNKNTWDVKKIARPIRSNIANRQVRLISAETKKLLYHLYIIVYSIFSQVCMIDFVTWPSFLYQIIIKVAK